MSALRAAPSGSRSARDLSSWKGRDVISVSVLGVAEIADVIAVSERMKSIVESSGSCELMKGKILAAVFVEPSTRTSSSFQAAMLRLGGQVIHVGAESSSLKKGESLEDTVRCMSSYTDLMALRHPTRGSAQLAADYSPNPVINAGDGDGEHPTQALLDMYTIWRRFGGFDGLTVTMVGDLKFGRTVHSLSRLLSLYKVTLNLISPPELGLPDEALSALKASGMTVVVGRDLSEQVVSASDVIYQTRIQKERFDSEAEYDKYKGGYVIDRALVLKGKPTLAVMHPLPRLWEIAADVDDLPQAAYFEQMRNGMFVRMALIAMVGGAISALM